MNTITIQEQPLNGTIPHRVAGLNRKLTSAFIICFLSMLFSGITSMLMSVYLPVVVKDLLQNASNENMNTISAYINAVFLFGSMFGGFTWGVICDKIGRSKAVILCTGLYGLFTILTAFSSSWLLIGIYRFFTGFGVGGILVTINILIAELWSEKRRAVVIGIVSSGMPVGFIAAGAMNNLLPNWHHAFLAGIIPVVVAIVGVFTLAESESWKTNKQTPVDSNSLNKKLFAPAYKSNLLRGSIIFGAMLIGLWAVFSWAPTWIQSITVNDAKTQDLRGNTMMLLAISGLSGSVVSGWIANAIGLRKTMMLCFAACFIMTVVVFKLNTSVSNSMFVEMGILGFFFGISQGSLSVFIPLLFPIVIRASATGFCFNIGRIFTATVVFFIGALVSFLGGYGNAIVIFSFIFLIGLLFTYFSKDETEAAGESEFLTAFAD
jgi:MFS family permease